MGHGDGDRDGDRDRDDMEIEMDMGMLVGNTNAVVAQVECVVCEQPQVVPIECEPRIPQATTRTQTPLLSLCRWCAGTGNPLCPIYVPRGSGCEFSLAVDVVAVATRRPQSSWGGA